MLHSHWQKDTHGKQVASYRGASGGGEGGREGVGDGREALMGDAGAHDEGKQERREQGKKGEAWVDVAGL